MHPTLAEQLAAMHRRELQEEAMMPYQMYQLYQIERPKTVAEIRLADEHAGALPPPWLPSYGRSLEPGGADVRCQIAWRLTTAWRRRAAAT